MFKRSVLTMVHRFALILLLMPLLSRVCLAETLYERSMGQFQAKALKAEPNDYSFVVLGDSRDGDAVFRKALQLARSFDPVFILHGGDYSGSGSAGETARFLQLVNETVPEIPLFVVMGNHENRGVFSSQIGPFDFVVESKRLQLTLVGLDNADNVLRRAELDYLRSRLSTAGKAGFVAMHVPPKTNRWSWHTFTEGSAELKKVLAESRVQAVFFSHVHLFDHSEFGGVPAYITGGAGAPLVTYGVPGDPVFHILVVRVKNGKASFRKVPIP